MTASATKAPSVTGPQVDYLRSLAKEHAVYGADVSPEETMNRLEATLKEGLSKQEASALLDTWKYRPYFPPECRPAKAWTLASLRKMAKTKAIFGLTLNPEETAERVDAMIAEGMTDAQARALYTQASRAKPHPTARSPLPLNVIEGIEDLPLFEGNFAVMVDDVLRFYRVYRPETGEYKGQPVIRRMASTSLLALYPAEARPALTAINADPDTAAFRYSDEFTQCWVCAKPLTDAVSRLLSVGPTCRGFASHGGLREAASEVDRDPSRRAVFRALRKWALDQGYLDPRNRDERVSMEGAMTASRLASAWSGLPGFMHYPADSAVMLVKRAIDGDLDDMVRHGLLIAPADTLLILLESGVLSAPVLSVLVGHPAKKVREAATDAFLGALARR